MANANSLLAYAQNQLKPKLKSGAIAIDATLGNGHDTLFLAQHIAPQGIVYGFDIQAAAIAATQTRLQAAGLLANTQLIQACHSRMRSHLAPAHNSQVSAIMFNLGYLPGADKSLITTTETTLLALDEALSLLADTGILTILAYPGHPGGELETAAVAAWLAQLPAHQYTTQTYLSQQHQAYAPRLFIVTRLS